MDIWTERSSPGKQGALSLGLTVLGVVFLIGFRDLRHQDQNALAGFGLGALLLILGIAGLLATGRQSVVVDPRIRHILVEDVTRLGARTREIPFRDIAGVAVGSVGRASSGVKCYYLSLELRDGSRYPLFAPGRFYPGSTDPSVAEGWKARLEGYLRG